MPSPEKYRVSDPKGWEIVSRDDICQRLAVGRNRFGVAAKKPQPGRPVERITHRRGMPRRLGIGEGTFGKRQGLVDPTENPQREGAPNFRGGVRILTEPVGEIAMPRRVVERDSLPKMVMGAGKVTEIPAGLTGNAVCNHRLGAIRPGRRFAQEKLGHFTHRCGFAAARMPRPKAVIGREPLRGVFLPARQFAGTRKGGTRFRRRMSLGPDQRIAEAGL